MTELAPPGPELAERNRELIAERLKWPEGALEACRDLEDRSPPWHCWVGVNDCLYARVPNSIVPVQVADTVSELETLMKAEQARWR